MSLHTVLAGARIKYGAEQSPIQCGHYSAVYAAIQLAGSYGPTFPGHFHDRLALLARALFCPAIRVTINKTNCGQHHANHVPRDHLSARCRLHHYRCHPSGLADLVDYICSGS